MHTKDGYIPMVDQLLGGGFLKNPFDQIMFFGNGNNQVQFIFDCKLVDSIFNIPVLPDLPNEWHNAMR